MNNNFRNKTMLIIISSGTILLCVGIYIKVPHLTWYWLFGIIFGCILQHFGSCFVSSASDPILTGSTAQLRGILIGILTASLGITVFKYLSWGEFDYMSVTAISIPLIVGAFLFGIGMVVAGCCASGMFVRLAEGYTTHLITIACVIAGYLFSTTHYESIWAPLIIDAPTVFLPEKLGWFWGVTVNIIIILLIYYIAFKWEKFQTAPASTSASYLTGGVFLGIFSIAHYVILESGWSITGAFYWLNDITDMFRDGATSSSLSSEELRIVAIGSNLRNIGLFIGALISSLMFSSFKVRHIDSIKQILRSLLGGLLMGYGAGIAGGCNITAFFTAAASLSLSAWIFMIFLFLGAFVGIKILFRFL